MLSATDFKILKNGIDIRIEIIMRVADGFLNITKMPALVYRLKQEDAQMEESNEEVGGIPPTSIKPAKHWFQNQDTVLLIEFAKKHIDMDRVYYELKAGTPTKFMGTYVHPKLYDHFMMWLDKEYAFKVYEILECIHHDANQKIIAEKDASIRSLHAKLDKIVIQNDELHVMNKEQDAKIDRLLKYGETTTNELHAVNEKLDIMHNSIIEFARLTLPMWVGSGVLKTQLDNLLTQYTLINALQHLKIAYVIGFVSIDGPIELKTYFCCTNFADAGKRISKLYNANINMRMLHPTAISLVSCEINTELAMVRGIDLPNITTRGNKVFTISLNDGESFDKIYDEVIIDIRRKRLQPYQMRRDTVAQSATTDRVITTITDEDNQFFNDALPFSQNFLDCYVHTRADGRYDYLTPSRKTTIRADLENERLTDRIYPLRKIRELLELDVNHDDLFDSE